jgi:phage-related protein
MENHPIVGKIIGFLIVMSGAFQALYPIITVALTMFSGFGSTLAKIFPKLIPIFTQFKASILQGLTMVGQQVLRIIPIFTQFKAKIVQGLLMIGRQALAQGARMAAGLLIGIGPVGWIIAAVIGLVALIVWKWDEIVAWTKKTWDKVWNWIKSTLGKVVVVVGKKLSDVDEAFRDVFNKVLRFLDDIDLFDSGKKIIQSAIDGILSMGSSVGKAVGSIAGKIRDFFPFSPAKEGPLSTLHRLDFAGPVTDSIARGKGAIQGAMRGMLTVPDFGMNPQLSAATSQSMNVSTSARYEAPDNSGLGAEIRSALEGMTLETTVEVEGERIVKATGKPMMKFIDQETKKAGRGR